MFCCSMVGGLSGILLVKHALAGKSNEWKIPENFSFITAHTSFPFWWLAADFKRWKAFRSCISDAKSGVLHQVLLLLIISGTKPLEYKQIDLETAVRWQSSFLCRKDTVRLVAKFWNEQIEFTSLIRDRWKICLPWTLCPNFTSSCKIPQRKYGYRNCVLRLVTFLKRWPVEHEKPWYMLKLTMEI